MDKRVQVGFAAINQRVERAIPENKSTELRGRDFIAWGTDNKYPEFLFKCYKECSTLQSVINGIVDYVTGNQITGFKPNPNEELEDVVAKLIGDYLIYGCAYINVIRSMDGRNAEIYWMDARKTRTNEDNTVFFYSEDWSKSYGRVKTIVLPKYMDNGKDASSVIMIKTPQSRETYPSYLWESAVKSVTTEIEIDKYHLNEITNNFSVSAIINFNNGTPEDEQKDEIEKSINEKFTGSENAGRFLLCFNDSAENAATIERLTTDDYDERYDSLQKRVRQSIFTAFRANPNLFGIPTENLGFSNEEYESAFKLFNRTVVRPIQKLIVRTFEKIGLSVVIEPFTLEDKREENVTE